MASITFTHALAGAQTLQSSWPNVHARRFQNWTPSAKSVGEAANALGDGRLYRYEHRPDALASFEIAGLNNDTDVIVAQLLMHHLLSGGTCSIVTDDIYGNIYATCGLAPDTEPSLTLDDRVTLEYRMSLTLLNIDPVLTLLQCVY